ncbi:MAG: primosomal protein N' [Paludibacteraceae bacterium]|nr:primosomal protein N' [Paludibacteraceae bacterium]
MFADIIVPLPLSRTFSYLVPDGMTVSVGSMVVVPFGRTKTLTGVVAKINQGQPSVANPKYILDLLHLSLLPSQIELLQFTSHYYSAPIGEVYHQVLPSQLTSKDGAPDSYKPQVRIEYSLNPIYTDSRALESLRKTLRRASKQLEALDIMLSGQPVENLSSAIRLALLKRGVIIKRECQVSRIDTTSSPSATPVTLTEHQSAALSSIRHQFGTVNTVLLHGVTSSGKTEIYLNLIRETVGSGGQALFLVPETGLTQHLYDRLKQYFGSSLGLYHTQCSQSERTETFLHQLSGHPYDVILGTKNALFLPFRKLDLVIVDEEHDTSYKQSDHIPYFNARDLAIYLAHIAHAKTLLGSATPSVESFANAMEHKYGYAQLTERYGKASFPQFHIVDLAEERRKKHLKGHFSRLLVIQMTAALNARHQVILFQNRNGFSPFVQCSKCGYVPKCPHCDVSLTYSKVGNNLRCSYCGYTQPFQVTCPSCGSVTIEPRGLGVEQVEEETRLLFPDARVARVTSKNALTTLNDFHNGDIDILIGTRSLVKGIDYKNVSLLGVLNVDNILNHPDFRANERAFQLLVQAAGRTGRHTAEGHLLLQTYQIDNPFFDFLKGDKSTEFYEQQIAERQLFNYPPFTRLLQVEIRHSNLNYCLSAADYVKKELSVFSNIEITGPIEPMVSYVDRLFIRQLMVRLPLSSDSFKIKSRLQFVIDSLKNTRTYDKGIYIVNVDPV